MKYQQSTSSGDLIKDCQSFKLHWGHLKGVIHLPFFCHGYVWVLPRFCPMWRNAKKGAGYYGSSNSPFLCMSYFCAKLRPCFLFSWLW
jgi:hypothetical protein